MGLTSFKNNYKDTPATTTLEVLRMLLIMLKFTEKVGQKK